MNRLIKFFCFLFFFLLFVTGCEKIIEDSGRWEKTFGGTGDDWGNSVSLTNDGGYILTGKTYSYGSGNGDVWIIKTDSLGNKEFSKVFGGNNEDWGNWVEETNDNGFIIVGVTNSYGGGSYDVWLIKTDDSGNKLFSKTFGDVEEDLGYCVKQTEDMGYIITGGTKSFGGGKYDVYLVKTNENGEKIWSKTFGGDNEDWGYSVYQTGDKGYIITGITTSYGAGSGDVWLIKTDSLGNKKWDKKFGGSQQDGATSIDLTSDGGYIITGMTNSYGSGNGDIWLIKIDENGNKLWDRTFGGPEQDGGTSVKRTMDGGYIITGMTKSKGEGKSDVWLIKTDSQGNTSD